jgi:hypothetical protein
METEAQKLTAPYVPFQTFLNALDHLKAIGVPHKIDRQVFPSFSGVNQGQVLGAFRFLQLIDHTSRPTPNLHKVVDDTQRKAALQKILKEGYPELVALGLIMVSPSQFDAALSDYGVAGATHGKAKSFFVKAAQFADLPLSPLLTRSTRNTGTRRKKSPQSKGTVVEQNGGSGIQVHRQPPAVSGDYRTVKLRGGGELTLSYSASLFDLVGKDREFVFGLIDKIKTYESDSQESSEQ